MCHPKNVCNSSQVRSKIDQAIKSLIYLADINKLKMALATSAPSFRKLIESSTHLIIPSVSFLPRQLYFPAAREISIVNWNTRQVYSWLHPRHFPAAERINYVAKDPLPFGVQIMFTADNPQFQFHEWSCLGLSSQFDQVPWNNIYNLTYIDYCKLIKEGTNKIYINEWEKYIAEVRKEYLDA